MASNGNVVWSGTYDAFGNCEVGVETVENNLRLPGQYYDAETGLYYNLNRYYDPKIGRYLQPDPAGDGLNPYAYVGANPVNAIDPLGLCALRQLGTRGLGGLRAASGLAEIGTGFYFLGQTGGLASAAAWLAVINGADNFMAGWNSLLTGEERYSPILEAPIHALIPNDTIADMVYMSTQLAIGYTALQAEWTLQARRAVQAVFPPPPRSVPAPQGNYVIGLSVDFYDDATGALRSGILKPGESHLDPWIDLWFDHTKQPFQLWKSNKRILRDVMSQGRPIRDISSWTKEIPIGKGRFLRAERLYLKENRWMQRIISGEQYWVPPNYSF